MFRLLFIGPSLQDENHHFLSEESEILSKLMSDHETLGLLFSGRSLPSSPAGSSILINGYLYKAPYEFNEHLFE